MRCPACRHEFPSPVAQAGGRAAGAASEVSGVPAPVPDDRGGQSRHKGAVSPPAPTRVGTGGLPLCPTCSGGGWITVEAGRYGYPCPDCGGMGVRGVRTPGMSMTEALELIKGRQAVTWN